MFLLILGVRHIIEMYPLGNVILKMAVTVGDIRVERVETKLRGVERHVLLPLFVIDFFVFP